MNMEAVQNYCKADVEATSEMYIMFAKRGISFEDARKTIESVRAKVVDVFTSDDVKAAKRNACEEFKKLGVHLTEDCEKLKERFMTVFDGDVEEVPHILNIEELHEMYDNRSMRRHPDEKWHNTRYQCKKKDNIKTYNKKGNSNYNCNIRRKDRIQSYYRRRC